MNNEAKLENNEWPGENRGGAYCHLIYKTKIRGQSMNLK